MYNLTTSQYERVRNLVRRSPVFIGMRVVINDDQVEILEPEELEFNLHPVLEAVAGEPPDQWPSLVDDCLQRLVNALTGGSPELDGPTEQILDRVYAKLRPVEGSPTEWWSYAREIAPDLLMVLALDHPDHIAILNDEQVRRHDFGRLLDAGMENLCGQLPDRCAEHAGIFILSGAEYVASTVLVIPWVVEAVTGDPGYPHGVLVAMPNDNVLVFHVVRDGAATRYAIGEIARVAAEEYSNSPRPLSPNVYWWSPEIGALEPVAHYVGDANGVIGQDVATHYSAGFATVLDELDRVRG